ncbi:hypothetical protein RRG08_050859 [Elysia crispata]|uniref:SCP domain-containing protein n=1 Tax=Elysia crispata TaxID=231223 RepID=A0AAE1DFA8_9GAST|nr:hypothetical protein RRG08_050859 [Elysia crispata]
MKTAFILSAIGAFIAAASACTEDYAGDADGNPCQNVRPSRYIDGTTYCCSGGRLSYSSSTVRGVKTTSCKCSGGSAPRTLGNPKITKKLGVSLEAFRQQGLRKHNELRALHGSPPLRLSDDLNQYAQKWAEQMARENNLHHSARTLDSGAKVGENIAMRSSSSGADYTGDEPVQLWYNEIGDYDFSKTNGQPNTGHFTAVVWKETTELGMGKARTADGRAVYAVASYRTQGNVNDLRDPSKWMRNVPPLLSRG